MRNHRTAAACRLFRGVNTLLIIPGKLSIMRSSKRDTLRIVARCPIYRP